MSRLSAPILASLLSLFFSLHPGFAQTDIAPGLLNRPPIAAPTARIAVGAIPVVLSANQEAEVYVSGALQGLTAGGHPQGVGLVVVKDDHVMFQRALGAIAPDTPFSVDPGGAFGAVAAMQLLERRRLSENDDLRLVSDDAPSGTTLAQMLTHQAGDGNLLRSIIEKASGTPLESLIVKGIAQPLGMLSTSASDGGFKTTLTDMSHLAIALVNGGAFENGHILEPTTVDLMQTAKVTSHPALPGWAYGFAEIHRNGWRGLQADNIAAGTATRLVFVPEARLAYFIVASRDTDATFWHILDNALFDKLLPPQPAGAATAFRTAAPAVTEARAMAGIYEPSREPAFAFTAVKLGPRLEVDVRDDGALMLSGAESATLIPRPGGYWSSADGNLNAVARDGRLILSTGAYQPLAFYKRPMMYAALAVLIALAAAAFIVYERGRRPDYVFPSRFVLAAASVSLVFLLISVFVWLLSPVA